MNKTSYITSLLLVILLNIFFSFLGLKFDLTEDKKHTISEDSIEILSSLEDQIFIKIYLDGDFPVEFKHLQNEIINILKSFKLVAKDNLDFILINPNSNNNNQQRLDLFKQLVNDGLTPTDIEIQSVNSKSNQIIFPGALIYYKEKYRSVNFLKNSVSKRPGENINHSIESLEYELISTIYNLINNNIDNIAFLNGNGQLTSTEVYDLTHSVLQDNNKLSYHYNVDEFNLKEYIVDSISKKVNISKQISDLSKYKVVIIAKPTIPFNTLEKFIIDQYIMNGGKVLWFIDGVTASMDSLQNSSSFIALKNDLNLDHQLFKYGVRINSNLIEDLRSAEIPVVTGYSNNMPQQSLITWPYFPLLFSKYNHVISKNLDAIKCDFISSIDTIKNEIKKTILLSTSKQSRINASPSKISLGILENPPPISSFNKPNLPVAVLLEGKFESIFKNRILPKEQSINFKETGEKTQMIVVSDGDIPKNMLTAKGDPYPLGYDKYINHTFAGNKKFVMNAIHYLCDDIGLIKLKSKEIKLRLLDKQKINNYRLLIQLFNIMFPLIFIFIFSVILIKLKERKYA